MAVGLLDEVSPNTWQEAAALLNQVGVFANEGRKFPSPGVLEGNASDLEKRLRAHGYTGGPIDFIEVDPPREGVTLLVFDQDQIPDPTSAQSRWYEDYRKRWKRRVTERLSDWLQRLEDLKRDMQAWLPAGYSLRDRPPVPIHEELMRKFGVAPAKMPSFDIVQGSTPILRVQPKGLWTIGANGRVDLVGRRGTFILVDRSEPLSGNPQWEFYSPSNRRAGTELSQVTFTDLLV